MPLKDPEHSEAASASQAQPSMSIQDGLSLAMQHQSAGRIGEAERIYRQILEVEPNQPVALHLLGVIAHMAGQSDIAIQLIRTAINHAPEYLSAHGNLGKAFLELGRFDEAIVSYGKTIAINPHYAGLNALLLYSFSTSPCTRSPGGSYIGAS